MATEYISVPDGQDGVCRLELEVWDAAEDFVVIEAHRHGVGVARLQMDRDQFRRFLDTARAALERTR